MEVFSCGALQQDFKHTDLGRERELSTSVWPERPKERHNQGAGTPPATRTRGGKRDDECDGRTTDSSSPTGTTPRYKLFTLNINGVRNPPGKARTTRNTTPFIPSLRSLSIPALKRSIREPDIRFGQEPSASGTCESRIPELAAQRVANVGLARLRNALVRPSIAQSFCPARSRA